MDSQSQNSPIKHYIPYLLLAIMVGIIIGIAVAPKTHPFYWKQDLGSSLEYRVQQVLRLVETQYVDNKDADTLTDHVINSILTSLDPHSHYLSANELKRQSEDIQGHFEGIGAILTIKDDTKTYAQPRVMFSIGESTVTIIKPTAAFLINNATATNAKITNQNLTNVLVST